MIKKKISETILSRKKAITMEEYINICLYDKDGYYIKLNPIGKSGDFITAPEISQLFGEVIGLFIFSLWQNNFYKQFNLIELGPGKGTLLIDILNITKNLSNFHGFLNIILLEKNKYLISEQKKNLYKNGFNNLKIKWLNKINFFSKLPNIIYANEFFDCLPIRQFQKKSHIWYEKMINFHKYEERFFFEHKEVKNTEILLQLNQHKKDNIVEISTQREEYFHHMCKSIINLKGAIIIVDYGYLDKPNNFTLQSVYNHRPSNVLENLGMQDITSLIDFKKLIYIAKQHKLHIHTFCTQREFLLKYGIKERKNIILKKCSAIQKKIIEKGLNRLINDDMGSFFKVLVVCTK